ncbi:hypothetical protein CEXT_547491 [Caerostris extrusa]|uniref:Uncharacterized protein n=1 Tax=Caerostris extrusa TaxID=172846 RepID=A0AAV4UG82_CAEEX|nr:hypothetical protein CEXT_547491 [Caerostris extrusa]
MDPSSFQDLSSFHSIFVLSLNGVSSVSLKTIITRFSHCHPGKSMINQTNRSSILRGESLVEMEFISKNSSREKDGDAFPPVCPE